MFNLKKQSSLTEKTSLRLRPAFYFASACALTLSMLQPLSAFAHGQTRATSNYANADVLTTTLNNLTNSHTNIDELAVSPTGQWVIVAGKARYYSGGVPQALRTKIAEYLDTGRKIDAVAMASNGSWVVAAEDWFYRSAGVPLGEELQTVVKTRQNAGRKIDEIVFTPAGGFIVLSEGYYYAKNSPTGLFAALRDTDASKRKPKRVSIGTDGRWVVVTEDQAFASGKLDATTYQRLQSWQKAARPLDHVVLGKNNDHIFYAHDHSVKPKNTLLEAVEYGLVRPDGTTANIWQRIEETKAPGVTLAIIDNNRVAYARGYGLLESGKRDRWVSNSSPYAVASMSKFVTSIGLARAIKESSVTANTDVLTLANNFPNGHLDIWRDDADNYYAGNLPTGITLGRLMRHEAGIISNQLNNGWGGYIPHNVKVPTSWLLQGYGCNGNDCDMGEKQIWFDAALGIKSSSADNLPRYSNGGYELIRAAMEVTQGGEFSDLMQTSVLDPLGMTNSTFDQPLPGDFEDRAAAHHDANGKVIPYKSYQWVAGGGLYTTPADYARAMLVIMDQQKTVQTNFLTQNNLNFLLTDPFFQNGGYAGGIRISHNNMTPATVDGRFAHGGNLPDQAWSRMVGSPNLKKGIVLVVNQTTPQTARLVCEIEKAFREAAGIPTIGCAAP